MFAVKTTRYKNKYVSYKRTYKFRNSVVVFSGDKLANQVYSTGFYNNIYRTYQIITNPVGNNTYLIKVTLLDTQNEDSGIQGSVVINFTPLPPVNVQATLVGNTVTLTWQASNGPTPDFFIVYGNGGGGTTINRSSPLATVSGSTFTTTFIVANGNWNFVVEAKKGTQQSVSAFIVNVIVPVANVVPPKPGPSGNSSSGSSPFAATNLTLTPVNLGAVQITFLYLYGALADSFNIYHDGGSGVINFNSPAFTMVRQNQLIQSYTTPQLFTADVSRTYQFVVRASISGNEEKNTDIYSVIVDGGAPSNPISLVLDSVF